MNQRTIKLVEKGKDKLLYCCIVEKNYHTIIQSINQSIIEQSLVTHVTVWKIFVTRYWSRQSIKRYSQKKD